MKLPPPLVKLLSASKASESDGSEEEPPIHRGGSGCGGRGSDALAPLAITLFKNAEVGRSLLSSLPGRLARPASSAPCGEGRGVGAPRNAEAVQKDSSQLRASEAPSALATRATETVQKALE